MEVVPVGTDDARVRLTRSYEVLVTLIGSRRGGRHDNDCTVCSGLDGAARTRATIQSQLAAIKHYAQEHAFQTTVALTYTDEGFSGSRLDRPALDELRDHAREGRFQAVVVLCPDRLARKYAYQVLLIEELARVGVTVHFCERPITDSPDDQLLLQIQGAIAEYERAKILERSRRGRLYRARLGEIGHSHPPYGYRYAAKRYGGDGRVRIHEEEAAMVRQVFAWYAEDGMTLYKLLQRLDVSAWAPRCGKLTWTGTTVLRMLRCEWYIGKAYYNRTRSRRNDRSDLDVSGKKVAKTTLVPRPPTEWIPVAVPPLIDETLFARVQQRIQENRRFARRRLKQEGVFLLKGLLKCGRCGHAYIGETRREPRRRRDGSEYLYHYYTCGARMTPINNGVRHRCKNWRLYAAGVNEAVWHTLRDLLLNSEELHQQLTAWVERTATMPPSRTRSFGMPSSGSRNWAGNGTASPMRTSSARSPFQFFAHGPKLWKNRSEQPSWHWRNYKQPAWKQKSHVPVPRTPPSSSSSCALTFWKRTSIPNKPSSVSSSNA